MTARKQQRFFLQAPSENGTLLIGLEDLVSANNNNARSEVCILTTDVNGEVLQGQEVYVLTEGQVGSTFSMDQNASVTIMGAKPSGDDEELTSLAWLQDRNLLQNINLTSAVPSSDGTEGAQTKKTPNEESRKKPAPPEESDEAENSSSWDDGISMDGTIVCSMQSNLSAPSEPARPQPSKLVVTNGPTDRAATTKPPHSFSALIFLAIESSPSKALPVRDIYAWITQHFPYYRQAPVGWKNSVRHNLSLNKCFYKVECGLNMSKGSYWMVDPQHRPQLIQSLCKVSYIKAELIQQLIKEAGLPSTPVSVTRPKDPGPVADRKMTTTTTTSPSPSSTCSSTTSSSSAPARPNLPDPKLFPFLSRRLAFGTQTPPPADGPDVDAATAMLALGQSPSLVIQPRSNGAAVHQSSYDGQSTSPSDDHTYSFSSPRPVVIPPANGNSKRVPSKRPLHQQEIAQQVPDMVKELEVHTYVLPQDSSSSSTPSRPAKVLKTRGGGAPAMLTTRGRGGGTGRPQRGTTIKSKRRR